MFSKALSLAEPQQEAEKLSSRNVIGALRIRIGVLGPLYDNYNTEHPKIV